jgi:hypothetical protein
MMMARWKGSLTMKTSFVIFSSQLSLNIETEQTGKLLRPLCEICPQVSTTRALQMRYLPGCEYVLKA